MRIGVSLNIYGSQTASGAAYTEAMCTAEKVGFDGIWFFDALSRGTFRVDPISGMSAAAAVTASAAAFGQKRKITVKEPRKENRKHFAKMGGWKVAPAPQTECASERQQTDYVHTLR